MRKVFLTAVTLALLTLGAAPAAFAQADATINMTRDAYDQPQVTISAGRTVLWNNPTTLVHTVTADDNSFDSADIAAGGQFSMEFDTPGTYAYYCQYHGDVGGVG